MKIFVAISAGGWLFAIKDVGSKPFIGSLMFILQISCLFVFCLRNVSSFFLTFFSTKNNHVFG